MSIRILVCDDIPEPLIVHVHHRHHFHHHGKHLTHSVHKHTHTHCIHLHKNCHWEYEEIGGGSGGGGGDFFTPSGTISTTQEVWIYAPFAPNSAGGSVFYVPYKGGEHIWYHGLRPDYMRLVYDFVSEGAIDSHFDVYLSPFRSPLPEAIPAPITEQPYPPFSPNPPIHNTIPETSTWLMLLIGFVVLGSFLKKAKKINNFF